MLNKIKDNKWKIIIISIVFIFFIFISASFFYFLSLFSQYTNINTKNANIDISGNYWLGTNNPRITIIEFSDFACPYCQESFSKIREISVKYKKDIKFIYKDFPILAEHSPDLAMAARCAGEQGLFWVMHDKLFLNQGVSTQKELIELANQIGLEKIQFKNCIISKKYSKEIEKDIEIGKDLGVVGTPTWFINGQKIQGNIPYDIFINIIEKLLNN